MASFQKRGKYYYLRWFEDGRERKRSMGPDVKTPEDAQEVVDAFERKRGDKNVVHIDTSRITLGQLRRELIDHLGGLNDRPGLVKPGTRKRYDVALKALANSLGDNYLLRNITTRRLQVWSRERMAHPEKPVKPSGVNADLRHIRAALNTAAEWGYLAKAPKVKMVKAPKPMPRRISHPDLTKLFKAEKDPDRLRLWIFIAYTGCRRREALGARWEDIVWEPRPVLLVRGKGDKERLVPLFAPALEALGKKKDKGWVFTFVVKKRGQKKASRQTVHPDTVTHWMEDLATETGVRATVHSLRHTYTAMLAEAGISMRFIQEILGHASVTTTEGYGRGALVVGLYDELSTTLFNGPRAVIGLSGGTKPEHSEK